MKLLCAFLLVLVTVSLCYEHVLGRDLVRRLKRDLEQEDEDRSCHGRYCQKYKPNPVVPRVNVDSFDDTNEVRPPDKDRKRCHGSYCQ